MVGLINLHCWLKCVGELFSELELPQKNENVCSDLGQEECTSRGRQIEEVSSQLAAEKDRHSRLAMETAANSKSRDAAALQEKTQELSQLKLQLDRWVICIIMHHEGMRILHRINLVKSSDASNQAFMW